MVSRFRYNPKKDIHQITVALNHRFFADNRDRLFELFVESLETPCDSANHPQLQIQILKEIIAVDRIEKRYRRYKEMFRVALRTLAKNGARIERKKQAQNMIKEIEDDLITFRWMIGRLQAIGDGIAWRIVDYDRIAIRLLADHQPVSIPQIGDGLIAEVETFENIVNNSTKLCLLNSITHLVRTGDIITYTPGTRQIGIIEVKAGDGASNVGGRVRRQTNHRQTIQFGLDSTEYWSDGKKLTRLISRSPVLSYVRSVGNAIKEAKERGIAYRLFGDYLSVVVSDANQAVKIFPKEEWPDVWARNTDRLFKVRKRPADVILPVANNYFAVANVSPNLAPYAIFPLETSLRFAIMIGEVSVQSLMNISGLGRWLEKRGWNVEIPELPTEPLGENDFPYVGALQIWNKDGIGCEFSLEVLMAAAMEFRRPESFESEVITIIEATKSGRLVPGDLYQVTHINSGRCAWD